MPYPNEAVAQDREALLLPDEPSRDSDTVHVNAFLEQLATRAETLEALLRKHRYRYTQIDQERRCVECGRIERVGCADTCAIAIALGSS